MNKKNIKESDISSCNCFIGFLSGENLYIDDFYVEVNKLSKDLILYKKHGLTKREPLSPKQLVDNRRGYLSRFNFCPYCGKEINWKELINTL
jgi:hypothetical protein